MVIGFDGSRAFLSTSSGQVGRTGTENYSFQLLKALARIDHKNKYVVYLHNIHEAIAARMLWPGNFEFKEINWLRLWTQGGLALECLVNPPDVLFVPAHTLPVLRRPGLKTVVTVHDLGAEYLPKMHQIKQRIYLNFMTRSQIKSATKIIAVSRATKNDLVKKIGIDGRKVEVVYEAYDKENFKSKNLSRAKSRDDTLVNSLIPYFLFVGTVQPRKNLERVIEAFSCVIPYSIRDPYNIDSRIRGNDKLKLIIVGSKGWLSDEIYKLSEKLGIKDKVKFLGYVPDQKLPVLYRGAIALVFPSLFEGFGLPILEAQASGCPVITSNISSMPEVAGKGAILVDPYSMESIKDGMVKGMDKELRSRLVELGKENIKRFSWEKCARETLAVLESL